MNQWSKSLVQWVLEIRVRGAVGREHRSPKRGLKDTNKDVARVVGSRRLFLYTDGNDSVEGKTSMV